MVRFPLRLLSHMASRSYATEYARIQLLFVQGWLKSVYPPNRLMTWTWKCRSPSTSLNQCIMQVCKGVLLFPSQPMLDDGDSMLRWGAVLDPHQTQGLWTFIETPFHINMLELREICQACMAFLPRTQGLFVQIMIDNMTIMFYVNTQRGAWSLLLCQEAVHLWNWCIHHQVTPVGLHQPGLKIL